MAWNYLGYHGLPPPYVYYPEPAFVRDELLLQPWYDPAAPVTFRQAPFYDYGFIRGFRHHAPDLGHRGFFPPEQVLGWREGERRAGPWWHNHSDFPRGHRVFLVDDCGHHHSEETLEFYVPLCCYKCERRVKDYLSNSPGVKSVTADQLEKKVVVVGRNLRGHDLLRGLQRRLNMPGSAFWEDRPCWIRIRMLPFRCNPLC